MFLYRIFKEFRLYTDEFAKDAHRLYESRGLEKELYDNPDDKDNFIDAKIFIYSKSLDNKPVKKWNNKMCGIKRTKAKEKLYKIINSNIREIRKNFNVGITTGISGNQSNYWKDPYRHWNFISSYSHFDETLTKRGNKKNKKK